MSDTGMYDLIARNKRNAWLLVLTLAALLGAVAAALGYHAGGAELGGAMALQFGIMGFMVAGTLSLISYFTGTAVLMAVSGAHLVSPEQETQLHNVVEELCIAAGLPKPQVYVIEDSAPNAFACGRNPAHSALAVTRGLMDKLNRNELQGVIAHEMSHIQNFDILFATLISVLVGTIVLLCDMFRRYTLFGGRSRRRDSSRDSRGGGQLELVLTVIALVLLVLAPLFAQIIQLAVSRQREYLADASGAKLTRNPEALADALEKIAGDPEPLEAANRGTQHLFIINPLKGKASAEFQSWFSTHPPTLERIRRLREMT